MSTSDFENKFVYLIRIIVISIINSKKTCRSALVLFLFYGRNQISVEEGCRHTRILSQYMIKLLTQNDKLSFV